MKKIAEILAILVIILSILVTTVEAANVIPVTTYQVQSDGSSVIAADYIAINSDIDSINFSVTTIDGSGIFDFNCHIIDKTTGLYDVDLNIKTETSTRPDDVITIEWPLPAGKYRIYFTDAENISYLWAAFCKVD